MYEAASCAVHLQAVVGFDGFAEQEAPARPAPRTMGLGWRHLATLLLLAASLPVFALAALACLPVALLAGAAEGLRTLAAHLTTTRRIAPTTSR